MALIFPGPLPFLFHGVIKGHNCGGKTAAGHLVVLVQVIQLLSSSALRVGGMEGELIQFSDVTSFYLDERLSAACGIAVGKVASPNQSGSGHKTKFCRCYKSNLEVLL